MKIFIIILVCTLYSQAIYSKSIQIQEANTTSDDYKINEILHDVPVENIKPDDSSQIDRINFVKNEAYNYGLESAMYYEQNRLNAILEEHSSIWYQTFNFSPFIVNGNILLPSLRVTTSLMEQVSSTKIRRVKASYHLSADAEIVSSPPTWRDYLIRLTPKPAIIDEVLRPRSDIEKIAFDNSFKNGWRIGKMQAASIFESDLARLESALVELYDFRIKAAQGILTIPTTIEDPYPTRLSEDGKTLYVDDVIYQIEKSSEFTSPKNWKPVIIGGN